MQAKDIPEFLFLGAVVAVEGKEQTLASLSLETPLVNGVPAKDQVLYLRFKSGLEMEYDPARVAEIPGRPPAFVYRGARIFCKATPEPNLRGQGFSTALNGVWEIASYRFKAEGLQLVLKRPTGPDGGDVLLSRHFNSKTMFPVSDDCPLPLETPAYQLEKPVSVRKNPLRFKPKAD